MKNICTDSENYVTAGLLLIFDEVQTGMGRTGKLFGYEKLRRYARHHHDIGPKALGGLPVGAMLARGRGEEFRSRKSCIHLRRQPLACSVGLAVMKTLLKGGVLKTVLRWENSLSKG
jgi:acetylornithine/succinyldiaminopimelate/putrescine aminotransferase